MMKIHHERGFTIVESLVAITILVLAVVGAASAIKTGISSYTLFRNQTIAFFLAQEGFEQIRNLRDNNGLRQQNWLIGIAFNSNDPCWFGQACTVDPPAQELPIRCTGAPPNRCPLLRQDPVTGFYGYNSSWPETIFRREITVEQVNPDEIRVTVSISWPKGPVDFEFKAVENLLNWQ